MVLNIYFYFIRMGRTSILFMRIPYAVTRRLQPSKAIGKRIDVLLF